MSFRFSRGAVRSSLTTTTFLVVAIAIAAPRSQSNSSTEKPSDVFSRYVTKDGAISLPKEYSDTFAHLGSWAVAKEADQPVFEMHNVYAPIEDIRAYRKEGEFPDGAVLVKEITNVSSAKLTTGQSSWSTENKVWFVMIKDAKGRFPDNDLWGDGWGWALFEAKEPARNVATDYRTDCLSCHIPAKKDDWVYVRGYSALEEHDPGD
jgi:cytochrome c